MKPIANLDEVEFTDIEDNGYYTLKRAQFSDGMNISLIPCDEDGTPLQAIADLPGEVVANCQATADLYRRVGYTAPWIGYVTVVDGRGVGGGAFVGPPKDGCVEIAYYTLDADQGRRFASRTAAGLVDIARAHDRAIQIKAFTLKEENASTRILKGLGFSLIGVAQDADAGEVWEWQA